MMAQTQTQTARPPTTSTSCSMTHSQYSHNKHKHKQTRLFRGVRMRKWGKWVAEIRQPNKRTRIWLGSYSTPLAAAKAYDTAVYYLRGRSGRLNFPDEVALDCECNSGELSADLIRKKAAEVGARVDAAFQAGLPAEAEGHVKEEDVKANAGENKREREKKRKAWRAFDLNECPSPSPSPAAVPENMFH